MCGIREKWNEFMEAGESHLEDREYLEADDGDAGSEEEVPVISDGNKNLDGVVVSPYLSSTGKNIGDAIYLDYWFDRLSSKDFYDCWKRHEQEIKALVRYPGGRHEWLMVATLPELKCMGVPMWVIRKMTVSTGECFFYMDGLKCWHGQGGSGTMHRDLFKAIVMTYYESQAFDGNTYEQADGTVNYAQKLWANLMAFAMVYYPEGCSVWPGGLEEFLNTKGYQGE